MRPTRLRILAAVLVIVACAVLGIVDAVASGPGILRSAPAGGSSVIGSSVVGSSIVGLQPR